MTARTIAAVSAMTIRLILASITGLSWAGLWCWGASAALIALGFGDSLLAGVVVIVGSCLVAFAGSMWMMNLTQTEEES